MTDRSADAYRPLAKKYPGTKCPWAQPGPDPRIYEITPDRNSRHGYSATTTPLTPAAMRMTIAATSVG